jgi:hypothetical protein
VVGSLVAETSQENTFGKYLEVHKTEPQDRDKRDLGFQMIPKENATYLEIHTHRAVDTVLRLFLK